MMLDLAFANLPEEVLHNRKKHYRMVLIAGQLDYFSLRPVVSELGKSSVAAFTGVDLPRTPECPLGAVPKAPSCRCHESHFRTFSAYP